MLQRPADPEGIGAAVRTYDRAPAMVGPRVGVRTLGSGSSGQSTNPQATSAVQAVRLEEDRLAGIDCPRHPP